jgi:hypothetical protein
MKKVVDYSKSASPRADALQDVIEELGERWDSAKAFGLNKVTDTEQFASWAGFAGVEGAPVEAWYDHYHGEGAWEKATGWSHFDKRNEFHPAKVVREHTDRLTRVLRNELARATAPETDSRQASVLDLLGPDELAAVEEWLGRMGEFTKEQEAELDRRWQAHITAVENHLIKRMVAKVEAQRRGEDNTHGRYILADLKLGQLHIVRDFLESYMRAL